MTSYDINFWTKDLMINVKGEYGLAFFAGRFFPDQIQMKIHGFMSHVIPFFRKKSTKKVSGTSNYFWMFLGSFHNDQIDYNQIFVTGFPYFRFQFTFLFPMYFLCFRYIYMFPIEDVSNVCFQSNYCRSMLVFFSYFYNFSLYVS